MSFEHDYYAILGVPSDADEASIKRAYRQLARRFHPDTSTEANAAERFLEIQEAYELLTSSLQREAYDHWRRQQGWDRPLPLQLRVTPSQTTLPCLNEKQVWYVLVELSASDEVESTRLPMNLALVLDRSTSMKGSRLQQVKEAARYIVDQMGPEDILALVMFSDRAQSVLPGQQNIDKSEARAAISSIQSGGGTEILQGLELGLREIERWRTDDRNSHLILLTDGQTYGDDEECLEAANLASERHIPLTMMGVGSDWNDRLLDDMADLSQGMSIYIDSSDKIARVFRDRIEGLGSIFARKLTLTIHLAEGVSLHSAFRVSPVINRLHFAGGTAALGSLEKRQPQAALLELLLTSRDPGDHRVLQLEAEAIVPAVGHQSVRAHQEVTLAFQPKLDRRSAVPPDIVSAMGKLTIFKMQERAMSEIEQGQIEPAVKRLKTLATRLLDIGETELARAALLEAGRLARTGSLSAEGSKTIRYGTRGLTILPKEVRHD
jgi:Ca-activated chloride channel family protein